jgi:hypothetical protein
LALPLAASYVVMPLEQEARKIIERINKSKGVFFIVRF